MSRVCERCGIGQRDPCGACDWCAAPDPARLPFLILSRRRLMSSKPANSLRRRGPMVTGVVVGILVHWLAAAVGVGCGLPWLWQTGFFWSEWWSLVPEPLQPWLFATVRGAAYGALAGVLVAAACRRRGDGERGRGGDGETGRRGERSTGRPAERNASRPPALPLSPSPRPPLSPSPRLPVSPMPATITAVVAFVVSSLDAEAGVEYWLIAALLAAAVGRLTALMMVGRPRGTR